MTTISILSTSNHPMLGYYLYSLKQNGFSDFAIYFDGKKTSQTDIDHFAERTGSFFEKYTLAEIQKNFSLVVNCECVESHNSVQFIKKLRSQHTNILLNVGTPRKITSQFIDSLNPGGIVNVHPGELPYYRGLDAVEWAIFNDDRVCNTVHWMSEEYDEGQLIDIEEVTLKKGMSYQEVRSLVLVNGSRLAARVMQGLFLGNFNANKNIRQNEDGACYYPKCEGAELELVKRKIFFNEYSFLT